MEGSLEVIEWGRKSNLIIWRAKCLSYKYNTDEYTCVPIVCAHHLYGTKTQDGRWVCWWVCGGGSCRAKKQVYYL
jgi:hypothetical protein